MNVEDAQKYFAEVDLQESLVLRFLFVPSSGTFDLVFSYAADVISAESERRLFGIDRRPIPHGTRDLRHLRFSPVVSVECAGTRIAQSDAAWRDYEKRIQEKPIVITGVWFSSVEEIYTLSIALGPFGKHTIKFKQLLTDRRLATGFSVGANKWAYRDHDTGEPIELYNPFKTIDM